MGVPKNMKSVDQAAVAGSHLFLGLIFVTVFIFPKITQNGCGGTREGAQEVIPRVDW